WNTSVAGHRHPPRWGRLLHADAGGAVARGDPCRRRLLLPERAYSRPCGCDEYAAERGLPRLWRAPSAVRGGADGRACGRAAGNVECRPAAEVDVAFGRHHGDGPETNRERRL